MAHNSTEEVNFSFLSNVGLLGMEAKSRKKNPADILSRYGSLETNVESDAQNQASIESFPLNVGVDKGIVSGKEQKMGLSGGSSNADTTIIGLELGKRTYFEEVSASHVGAGNSNSQMSGQMKRSRVSGQTPKCQVEGCKNDLSCAKDYHRRHKVCAFHSKATKVVVGGREQRFCQQCSRFHGLTEFDEGKRSCRRRLAGHNERRRKPQPDPLGLNASFLPAFQDSRKLGHFYMDRASFLSLPGISGVSSTHWNERNVSPSLRKEVWPSSFENSSVSTGSERQLFLTDLHNTSDGPSLFPSPQSPKITVPVLNDAKAHHYFLHQGRVEPPVVQSLSLTSPGSGVLSTGGLEAIPIGQGFMTRVSDSGRALSLQSNMQLSSSSVSMDSTTHSSIISDQNLDNSNPIPPSTQPLGQGGQQQYQHHYEWLNDKLFSPAAAGYSANSNTIEKDHHHLLLERSFMNSECLPSYSFLGDMPPSVKPTTIDLMQMSSTSQNQSTLQSVSSGGYEIGIGPFGDLQAVRSYDSSSMFSSSQM